MNNYLRNYLLSKASHSDLRVWLEWCAVFMLLSFPRENDDIKDSWFTYCCDLSDEFSSLNKQIAMFWWSLRYFAIDLEDKKFDDVWRDWREYLAWHYKELNIPFDKGF